MTEQGKKPKKPKRRLRPEQQAAFDEAFSTEATVRISEDLAGKLQAADLRSLVNAREDIQRVRIAMGLRAGRGATSIFHLYCEEQLLRQERNIEVLMTAAAKRDVMASAAMLIMGVGPVFACGLAATLDIRRAPTAGAIWSFAGIDGDKSRKWIGREKARLIVSDVVGAKKRVRVTEAMVEVVAERIGWKPYSLLAQVRKLGGLNRNNLELAAARRPWNAWLKRLCWLIGKSFEKLKDNPEAYYGRVYKERLEYEQKRNDAGGNREYVERVTQEKRFRADTDTAKAHLKGQISESQLKARARRYAVKLFLAHWHATAYELLLHQTPPNPYPQEHMGHVHMKNKENFGWRATA